MAPKDKELLLKDLCARLPYGVKIYIKEDGKDTSFVLRISDLNWIFDEDRIDEMYEYDGWKPYLRPISSMTEEEVNELFLILKINEENGKEWLKVNDIGIIRLFTEEGKDFYEIAEAIDYLHSIHIDYRGLIPMGLAIEVTKENNPYNY